MQRILQFEGGCNFRDLGGYRARDGRQLQWGKIFRTGVLSYFTPEDAASLSKLGVRAICDLRRAEERQREPTRWPDANARLLAFDDGDAPPTIRSIAARHPYTVAGMHTSMQELYRALPAWLGPRLRAVFEHITEGQMPLIVHCAAGKDRTGVVVAVLLAALDVPHDTILDDYLLTNDAGNFEEFILTRHQSQLGLATTNHPLLTIPDDIRQVIFSAHADFLQGAFDQIAADHGGVDAYLHHHGVDGRMRERAADALLT